MANVSFCTIKENILFELSKDFVGQEDYLNQFSAHSSQTVLFVGGTLHIPWM